MSSDQPESASGAKELVSTIELPSNDDEHLTVESTESLDLEQNNNANQDTTNDAIDPEHKSERNETSTTETACVKETIGRSDGLPGLGLVLAGGVIAAGLYFLKKKFSSSTMSKQSEEPAPKPLFLENFRHDTPSVAGAAGATPTPTLTEKRLAVSDRIDIKGIKTRFGSPEWQSSRKVCTVSAPIVDQLIHAGAVVIGTLPTWPLGLNPSFSSSEISDGTPPSQIAREIAAVANPSAPKGHTHGGGEYGPAVAIAAGSADLCIAVDEIGSALIPAACCGVYAYRPTSGVLQLEGAAAASSTLGTTCLLASDPNLLIRAAQALNVPGGGNDVAGIVSKYLVAEDLFALCDEQVKNSAPAVVAAVKRWAGPEHAQGLSLCDWLYHRIPSLAQFMPRTSTTTSSSTNNNNINSTSTSEENGSSTTTTTTSQRTVDVLSALTAAASAIRKWEWLRSPSGRWVSNKHRHATSAVSSVASGMSASESRAGSLPPEIVAGLLDAQHVSEKLYASAIAVADELSQGMRGALKEGYVFVFPTIPGPAPKVESGKKERGKTEQEFRNLSEQFATLASLAGVPQIVMPMPMPLSKTGKHQQTEKAPQISISMITLQRRDLMLVKAAAKLGPMLKEEAEKLAIEVKGASSSTKSTRNGSASSPSGANNKNSGSGASGSSSGGGGGGSGGSSRSNSKKKSGGGAGDVSELHARAAETAKEEGNIAFKQGRFLDAANRYSDAIQYNPRVAVYYSNRAMAYLKLGFYTAAEDDCDAALELDPSMVKALLRRGSAQLAQGLLEDAKKDFERVLYLEPRNKQAIEELSRLKEIETD